MRVADYIAEFFSRNNLDTVFMITGGGAMHLNDAFGRHDGYKKIFCHHEQACAMAADGYFRISGKPAVLQVTTGPGGINSMNGVYGAYVDSVPMIVVSGQVRTDTLAPLIDPGLRQVGDQEANITEMVGPITKYAHLVLSKEEVPGVLKKAMQIATSGRPGPVWIDVPINIQAADLDVSPDDLVMPEPAPVSPGAVLRGADVILEALQAADRPVVIAGNGVRFSGMAEQLRDLGETLGIPVTTVWNSHDLIPNAHPSFCGRTGADGDRAGNFSVQNADLILILGTRMAIRQVGFNHTAFGRAARKIMVDMDIHEMNKPTLKIDDKLVLDLKELMPILADRASKATPKPEHRAYLDWCRDKVARYPVLLPHHYEEKDGTINPYACVDKIFSALPEDVNIVTGDGTAAVVTFKAADLRKGQRIFTNKGCASMGFDLPASIGAYHADPDKPLVCIVGDGSLMMNLQELQTIVGGGIPLKIFIMNNDGYHSIRQAQLNYFDGFEVGCGPKSGVSFPSFESLAGVFGFAYRSVRTLAEADSAMAETMATDGPAMCEVFIDKSQLFEPRLASRKLPDGSMVSSPLEDMTPLLDRDTFRDEMIIATLDES